MLRFYSWMCNFICFFRQYQIMMIIVVGKICMFFVEASKKRDCCYRIYEECPFSKRGCSPHEIRQIQVYASSPKFADHSQTSTTFRSFLICQRFWSIYTPEKLTWHFKIPISVRNTSSNCGFSIAIFGGVISYVHYLCIYVMFILIYIHVYESEFSNYSRPYHWSDQESQTALVWLEFWPCFAELTFKNRGHRGQLGSISYTHIPIRKSVWYLKRSNFPITSQIASATMKPPKVWSLWWFGRGAAGGALFMSL